MAPPSSQSPPSARARRARGARSLAGWIVASVGLFGCQRTIDIARVQDPAWVATTIPYTGVREPTRQFPDYSSIDASILDQSAGGSNTNKNKSTNTNTNTNTNTKPKSPAKKGSPR